MKFRDIVKAPLISVSKFPKSQYIKDVEEKNQIVLHHTASGKGVKGDINTWIRDPKRIATAVLIDFEGTIHQCFSSKYWAYHLGVTNAQILKSVGSLKSSLESKHLNSRSIGIEIDCWGYLKKINGSWRAWPNKFGTTGKKVIIDEKNIQFYEDGYKGHEAYEKYTAAQIQTTKELLLYWHHAYDISLEYNDDIWDVTKRAMSGGNGVFTHNSYRTDKSDVHPQPELIKMLKDLSKLTVKCKVGKKDKGEANEDYVNQ